MMSGGMSITREHVYYQKYINFSYAWKFFCVLKRLIFLNDTGNGPVVRYQYLSFAGFTALNIFIRDPTQSNLINLLRKSK